MAFHTLLLVVALTVLAAACTPGSPPKPSVPPTATAASASAPPQPARLDTLETEFGNLLRLESARLLQPEIRQGEPLALALTWRLLRSTTRDLRLVIRLLDQPGRTRARHDATIGGLQAGTSRWPDGGSGTDVVELLVPPTLEPGRYALALAVAEPTSGAQIPISAEAGLPPVVVSDQQIVGAVHVAPAGGS